MSQLTFKFPFKTTYYKKDFYVSGMTDDVRRNYLTTHPIGTIITIN